MIMNYLLFSFIALALWRITYWQILSSIIYFYICLISIQKFPCQNKIWIYHIRFLCISTFKNIFESACSKSPYGSLLVTYSFNMQIINFLNEYPFGCLPAEGLSATTGETEISDKSIKHNICMGLYGLWSWVPLLQRIYRELVVGESHLKKTNVWVYSSTGHSFENHRRNQFLSRK